MDSGSIRTALDTVSRSFRRIQTIRRHSAYGMCIQFNRSIATCCCGQLSATILVHRVVSFRQITMGTHRPESGISYGSGLSCETGLPATKIFFLYSIFRVTCLSKMHMTGIPHHGESGEFYQDETGFVSSGTTPRNGLTGMFNHSGLAPL